MKQVFLDMDGVICDFTQGLIDRFGFDFTPSAVTHWGYSIERYKEAYPGKTESDMWQALDFLFWAQLKPTVEADVILGMVKKFRPVILTSAALSSPGVFDGKASWLRRHVPEYYNEGRILIGGTKHQLAGPDKLLIDDCEANCDDWQAHGGKAILVPRPWNRNRGCSVYNEIRHGLQVWEETT